MIEQTLLSRPCVSRLFCVYRGGGRGERESSGAMQLFLLTQRQQAPLGTGCPVLIRRWAVVSPCPVRSIQPVSQKADQTLPRSARKVHLMTLYHAKQPAFTLGRGGRGEVKLLCPMYAMN